MPIVVRKRYPNSCNNLRTLKTKIELMKELFLCRSSILQAGIGSPENPERVVIALEPEVASVYCRKLKVHQLMPDAPPSNKIFFLRDHVPDLNLQQAVDEQQGTSVYIYTT